MSRLAFFFALTLLFILPFASADIPRLISLQGRLTDASDNPISSSSNFAFRIYDAPTGGSPLWTESQTLSPNSLGIFNALLGSVSALNIPFNTSYWLEVQVNSEVLSPRQRLGSAGYALRSENPWNATGNDIYTTNAGNVGIGTAAPAQKLTVSGDVSWTGTLQGGSVPWARLSAFPSACPAGQYASAVGSSLTCSTPAAGISGSGTANYLPKWTGGTSLGNSVIYDNGNVGIGTTSPTTGKLVVSGGNIDMTNNKIINLVGPSVATDAATKGYVDTKVGSIGGTGMVKVLNSSAIEYNNYQASVAFPGSTCTVSVSVGGHLRYGYYYTCSPTFNCNDPNSNRASIELAGQKVYSPSGCTTSWDNNAYAETFSGTFNNIAGGQTYVLKAYGGMASGSTCVGGWSNNGGVMDITVAYSCTI